MDNQQFEKVLEMPLSKNSVEQERGLFNESSQENPVLEIQSVQSFGQLGTGPMNNYQDIPLQPRELPQDPNLATQELARKKLQQLQENQEHRFKRHQSSNQSSGPESFTFLNQINLDYGSNLCDQYSRNSNLVEKGNSSYTEYQDQQEMKDSQQSFQRSNGLFHQIMNIGPTETIQSKEQMAEKYLSNSQIDYNGEMSLALMSGGNPKCTYKTYQSSNSGSEKRLLSFGRKTSPYIDQNSMTESVNKPSKRIVDFAEKLIERITLKHLRSQLIDLHLKSQHHQQMLKAIEIGSDFSGIQVTPYRYCSKGSNLALLSDLVTMCGEIVFNEDLFHLLAQEKQTNILLSKGLDEIQKKFKLQESQSRNLINQIKEKNAEIKSFQESSARQNFQFEDFRAKSLQGRANQSFDGCHDQSRRCDTVGQSSLSATKLVQTIEPQIVSKLMPKHNHSKFESILNEKDLEIDHLNQQVVSLRNELSSQQQTLAYNSMCNTARPSGINSKNMTPQAPIEYMELSYRPFDEQSSKYQNDSYCPTPHESIGDLYVQTTQDENRDEKLDVCRKQIEALTNLVQNLQNQVLGRLHTETNDIQGQQTSYFKGAQFLIEDQNHQPSTNRYSNSSGHFVESSQRQHGVTFDHRQSPVIHQFQNTISRSRSAQALRIPKAPVVVCDSSTYYDEAPSEDRVRTQLSYQITSLQKRHKKVTDDLNLQIKKQGEANDNLKGQIASLKIAEQDLRVNMKNLQETEKSYMKTIRNQEQELVKLRTMNNELMHVGEGNQDIIESQNHNYVDLQQRYEDIKKRHDLLQKDNHNIRIKLQDLDIQFKEQQASHSHHLAKVESELIQEIQNAQSTLEIHQNDQENEVKTLRTQINDLQNEVIEEKKKSKDILNGFERLKGDVKKEKGSLMSEILAVRDQNLSLKIAMKEMEKQIEQDLSVQDELNERQMVFMKNRINDLETNGPMSLNGRRYNSIEYGTIYTQMTDRGGKSTQCSSAANVVLLDEFYRVQQTIEKLNKLAIDRSKQFQPFLEQFNEFKMQVLESICAWHQKTNEITSIAANYKQSINQYCHFNKQLKALVIEKNQHISRLQGQLKKIKPNHPTGVCSSDVVKDVLGSMKSMQTSLHSQLKIKTQEVQELVKYQDEFRDRYTSILKERDRLAEGHKDLNYLMKGISEILSLTGQNPGGDHLKTLKMRVIALIDDKRLMTGHLQNSDKEINELKLQLDKQSSLFKSQIQSLESSLLEKQQDNINQLEEQTQSFQQKEDNYEHQISLLSQKLEKLESDITFQGRQSHKWESKLQAERNYISDLERQLRLSADDKNSLLQKLDSSIESFHALQEKLHQTNELLDHRLKMIDEQDLRIKELCSQNCKLSDKVFFEIDKQEQIKAEYEQMKKQAKQDKEIRNQAEKEVRELDSMKKKLEEFKIENEVLKAEKSDKNKGTLEKIQLMEEIKRYQGSVAYLTRELNDKEATLLEIKKLEDENQKLKFNLQEIKNKHQSLLKLYEVNTIVPKKSAFVQTKETQDYKQAAKMLKSDQRQLREVIESQRQQIENLIQDKRELESKIEQSYGDFSQNKEKYIEQLEHDVQILKKDSKKMSDKIILWQVDSKSSRRDMLNARSLSSLATQNLTDGH